MSTYYGFVCKGCNQRGGFFSRQAWGWGNFDIVSSFQFISKHVSECGEDKVFTDSENGGLYDYSEDKDIDIDNFPHSNDWQIVSDYNNIFVVKLKRGIQKFIQLLYYKCLRGRRFKLISNLLWTIYNKTEKIKCISIKDYWLLKNK